MEPFTGYILQRMISPELIEGLKSGMYFVSGGTIRISKGYEGAGQIVRHLIPIFDDLTKYTSGISELVPLNPGGLATLLANTTSINEATKQLLNYGNQLMSVASFNLAVTTMGFAAMNRKLDQISDILRELQFDIRKIKEFLEQEEMAKLSAALADLERVSHFANEERFQAINISRVTLSQLMEKYKKLLETEEDVLLDLAHEETFFVTGLAHIRCYAEIGKFQLARQEMAKFVESWRLEMRKTTKNLLEPYVARFLFSDFVDILPITTLVSWLDFAYGEEKGIAWIDDLRKEMPPFYQPKLSFSFGSPIRRAEKNQFAIERDFIIPSLNRLVARNSLLDAYIAQYDLLEVLKITPSEFGKKVSEHAPENAVDGYLILEPVSQPTTEQKG